MIIPIGHDQTIRGYPWVTIALIALCTVVQIYSTVATPSERELGRMIDQVEESSSGDDVDDDALEAQLAHILDKIPQWRFGYHTGSGFSLGLLTSIFFHQGWLHLIGNMLFLWLAGSALEDRWGRLQFLAFYLVGGMAATCAFGLTYTGPPTFLVGASGAVSAAMGAFLVYFAKTEITLWYWLMYRTGTFRLAAYVALPLWIADQVLMANLDKGASGASGVAYAAHIGGFAFGAVVAVLGRMVFPRSGKDDDAAEDEASEPADDRPAPRSDDRVKLCLDAIKRRDLATVRTLASRAMIDLSRANNHAQVLELYRAVVDARFKTIPLTDGAFVAAAAAADERDDVHTFLSVIEALRTEHPGSMQVPKVLWRKAEIQGRAGDEAGELATLQLLAERYARHEYGERAVKELAKRRL